MQGSKNKVWSFSGDMGSETGMFPEGSYITKCNKPSLLIKLTEKYDS